MSPTGTPWTVTPGGIVGSAAKLGAAATRAPRRRPIRRTPRIATPILLIEEAGVIRDHAVGACGQNASQIVPRLHGPREDGGAGRPAARDDVRRHEGVVEHRGLRFGRGEHAADPPGERAAEHAEAGTDEWLERPELAQTMAVVRIGEARCESGLQPPHGTKNLRMKGSDDDPREKPMGSERLRERGLVPRRLHVEVEPDLGTRLLGKETERIVEIRAVRTELPDRMGQTEPSVRLDDVELDHVDPGAERGLDGGEGVLGCERRGSTMSDLPVAARGPRQAHRLGAVGSRSCSRSPPWAT